MLLLFISDTVDEDDDLYDFVEDEENKGDEIYEDLMRTEEPPEIVGVGSVGTRRVKHTFPLDLNWFPWCVHTAAEDRRGQARVLPAGDQTDGGEILRYARVYITGASFVYSFKFPPVDFTSKHFQTRLCVCAALHEAS